MASNVSVMIILIASVAFTVSVVASIVAWLGRTRVIDHNDGTADVTAPANLPTVAMVLTIIAAAVALLMTVVSEKN